MTVEILALFLMLEEKLSALSMMLAMGLSYMAFIMLRYGPCTHFVEIFYHKQMLNCNLLKCIIKIIWMHGQIDR